MKQFLGAMAILGLVFGVILFMVGWQENTLFSQGSPTPQVITLTDLETKGPGNNIHVTVTDVDFGLGLVYITEKNSSSWKEVWIPLVPPGHNQRITNNNQILHPQDTRPAKIVAKLGNLKNQNELDDYCRKTKQVTGLITSSIRSLGNKEKEILKKDYPNTDFNEILVLEVGRSFPSSGYVYGMMGGGAALFLLGLGFGVGWLLVKP